MQGVTEMRDSDLGRNFSVLIAHAGEDRSDFPFFFWIHDVIWGNIQGFPNPGDSFSTQIGFFL